MFAWYKINWSVIIIVFLGAVALTILSEAPSTPAPTPVNNTESLAGFTVPEGFSLSVFAKDLPGARVMAWDSAGDMWVSQTSKGVISIVDLEDGKIDRQHEVFRNLTRPHGMVIDGNWMYFAEETKVTRVALNSGDTGQKIADLPKGGGGHFTRSLLMGTDERIYVSIGSTCNVCDEGDPRHAAIYSMKSDGTDFKQVAKGLRNAVFMTMSPTGKIFVTEMGRDNLGDNVPPDEINVIPSASSGQVVTNFGWPICYGKNIHDDQFDKKTYIRNPCMEPFENESFVDLQAHSAPLGLAFVPSAWGEYAGDLLVAYHGSWNRSVPTGYKVVRLDLDANGNYLATHDFISDFILGWIPAGADEGDDATGRPVDLKFHDNALYISDDKGGVIYKLQKE